jgi:hypothetical protein
MTKSKLHRTHNRNIPICLIIFNRLFLAAWNFSVKRLNPNEASQRFISQLKRIAANHHSFETANAIYYS